MSTIFSLHVVFLFTFTAQYFTQVLYIYTLETDTPVPSFFPPHKNVIKTVAQDLL